MGERWFNYDNAYITYTQMIISRSIWFVESYLSFSLIFHLISFCSLSFIVIHHLFFLFGSNRHRWKLYRHIRRPLTDDMAIRIAVALVQSCLDYCNSLFFSTCHVFNINKLQRVQILAASLALNHWRSPTQQTQDSAIDLFRLSIDWSSLYP